MNDRRRAMYGIFSAGFAGSLFGYSEKLFHGILREERSFRGTVELVGSLGESFKIDSVVYVDERRVAFTLIAVDSGRLVIWDPPDDASIPSWQQLRYSNYTGTQGL